MRTCRRFTPEEDEEIRDFFDVYDRYRDSEFNLVHFAESLGRDRNVIRGRAKILGAFGRVPHRMTKTLESRYSVNKDTGCWEHSICTLAVNGDMILSVDGKRVSPRRFLWEKKHGTISGMQVLRDNCLNPKCINPDHMELLTPYESNQRNKTTKITPDKIKEMFILRERGWSTKLLAQRMNCHPSLVFQIFKGKRHLGALDPSRRSQ